MADDPFGDLKVSDTLSVPAWELQESFVRASGPGGQNVNKVATAVQLRWNVHHSSLPAPLKARFARRFESRLTQDGDIVLTAQAHRSQALNRQAARQRLADMISKIVLAPKRRIKTRPTRGSVRRRLEAKRQRGDVKQLRGRVGPESD